MANKYEMWTVGLVRKPFIFPAGSCTSRSSVMPDVNALTDLDGALRLSAGWPLLAGDTA